MENEQTYTFTAIEQTYTTISPEVDKRGYQPSAGDRVFAPQSVIDRLIAERDAARNSCTGLTILLGQFGEEAQILRDEADRLRDAAKAIIARYDQIEHTNTDPLIENLRVASSVA
jgi:hypothetical protein